MVSRPNLHEEFCKILESRNAYFQPPENIRMGYPAIRYSLSEPDQKYANNRNYSKTNRYEGIVIDADPESGIPDKLLEHFEMCRLGTPYVADNLNHFPFTLYY